MRRFLIGVTLCGASAAAFAGGETFTMSITGTYTRFSCGQVPQDQCPAPVVYPWISSLSFTTNDLADGTYSLADHSLSAFAVSTWSFTEHNYSKMSVTLAGGQVTGVFGSFVDLNFDEWNGGFSGSNVYLFEEAPRANFYEIYAGALAQTNAVPAVPEPQTYALLIAGVALLPLLARRRRVSGRD